MIVYFFLFALTFLFLLYLWMPLFKDKYWPYIKIATLRDLYEQKKTGIWAISDLDTEFEMGKLTEQDYRSLREQFKTEVLPLLQQERQLVGEELQRLNSTVPESIRKELLKEVLRICGKRFS